jgi:hypothetical protein
MSRDAYQPTGYKLDGEDLETILGPLEANVLKEVYILAKPVKVRGLRSDEEDKKDRLHHSDVHYEHPPR